MRRDERLGLEPREHPDDELEDLLPLRRVRPRAELVEDHHRPRRQALEERADPHQLRPEAPLRLVRLRLLDERHDEARGERERRRAGRNEQARLGQELREPERLQEAGLAPRVRAGDEHRRVVAIRRDVARDGLDAVREQERVEEAAEDARLPGGDEVRQRDLQPRAARHVVEGERAEVQLEVAEELHEPDDLVLEPVEHGVDEARHHLAVPEAVAAHEELDLGEPPSERGAHEGVLGALLESSGNLKPADPPVGADADLEVERGELLVVPKEVRERPVRLPGLDLVPNALRRRAPSGPPRSRAPCVDDLLHEAEDVELPSVGVPLPTPVAPSSSARKRQSDP